MATLAIVHPDESMSLGCSHVDVQEATVVALEPLLDHVDLQEATVVRLEQNYRSTQVILDAASALIRQNRNRKEKRLWTDRTGGAAIRYFRGGDELEA